MFTNVAQLHNLQTPPQLAFYLLHYVTTNIIQKVAVFHLGREEEEENM